MRFPARGPSIQKEQHETGTSCVWGCGGLWVDYAAAVVFLAGAVGAGRTARDHASGVLLRVPGGGAGVATGIRADREESDPVQGADAGGHPGKAGVLGAGGDPV